MFERLIFQDFKGLEEGLRWVKGASLGSSFLVIPLGSRRLLFIDGGGF